MKKLFLLILNSVLLFLCCNAQFQPGSIDLSFYSENGFTRSQGVELEELAIQPDGKIVTAGLFSFYGGTYEGNIARLNQDGTLDTTFNTGTGFQHHTWSLALQPDGKIIVGGVYTYFNDSAVGFSIIRLNSNGSIDHTFNPGSGFSYNGDVYTLALQPDGKVICAGDFTVFNGTPVNQIARLNADGSLDNTFNSGFEPEDYINDILLQPDGKIIVAGNFDTINNIPIKNIVRLNANGSIDNTFNPSSGFNGWIHAIALQTDGKIIAGGTFELYNGTVANYIARLNADGSTDDSFDHGGFNLPVTALTVEPGGKIIVGGGFTAFTGYVDTVTTMRIARLNSDGSLDTGFDTGTGSDWGIVTLAIQPDGRIIAGGRVETFDGITRQGIVRLHGDNDTSVVASFEPNNIAECPPFIVAFINNSENATSWLWDFGDGSTSTDENPIHTYSDSGSFSVMLIVSNGITSDTMIRVNDIFLNPVIATSFSLYPDSTLPHNWFIFYNNNGGDPPIYYWWEWGDGSYDSIQYPSHIYSVPGYYNICLTVAYADGCYAHFCDSSTYVFKTETEMITINVVNQLPNAINEAEVFTFTLYPNPASTTLTITTEQQTGKAQLNIYNTQGQLVLSSTFDIQHSVLDISSFPCGIYYLTLQNEEGVTTKKFEVVK